MPFPVCLTKTLTQNVGFFSPEQEHPSAIPGKQEAEDKSAVPRLTLSYVPSTAVPELGSRHLPHQPGLPKHQPALLHALASPTLSLLTAIGEMVPKCSDQIMCCAQVKKASSIPEGSYPSSFEALFPCKFPQNFQILWALLPPYSLSSSKPHCPQPGCPLSCPPGRVGAAVTLLL